MRLSQLLSFVFYCLIAFIGGTFSVILPEVVCSDWAIKCKTYGLLGIIRTISVFTFCCLIAFFGCTFSVTLPEVTCIDWAIRRKTYGLLGVIRTISVFGFCCLIASIGGTFSATLPEVACIDWAIKKSNPVGIFWCDSSTSIFIFCVWMDFYSRCYHIKPYKFMVFSAVIRIGERGSQGEITVGSRQKKMQSTVLL